MKPPQKPFADYKWRWAVLTPTESLNEPPVFLGVLRVFNKYQDYAPSAKEILDGLSTVQKETKSRVDLVRTQERNLVRNSGQYWKALGLLEEAHGKIHVSPFGQLLATGQITQIEFASTVIKTMELPNRMIISDTAEWDKAGLKIKPLELILDIIAKLLDQHGAGEAYITPYELVKIVIPLAGAKSRINEYVDALVLYRHGQLDLSGWPDCAPNSNDKRMAREFLLFLANYGFCNKQIEDGTNENEHYRLANISKEEITELQGLPIEKNELQEVVKQISTTQIPANIERKKVSREILERPYQNRFRKNVLGAFKFTCIITGVSMDAVLEAAHIIPISEKGSDKIDNGLCLRSDIHQLYDSGHLRLMPNGVLVLSELAATKNNYGQLPRAIRIPDFVNKGYLDWRNKYY